MSSVGIHPPKTPVTKGSTGIAKATIPNVCKMPGPPAPFVPSPLPNIAKSGMSPKGYSKKVKIEGNTVAIRGASFKSMGDMASKGTGGGLISANTHGPAKFITPGSLTVKVEAKSVHLLGEPMLNNCGASGSPPNTGATMTGEKQGDSGPSNPFEIKCQGKTRGNGEPWTTCDYKQYCAKVKEVDRRARAGEIEDAYADPIKKADLQKVKAKAQKDIRETWASLPTDQMPEDLLKKGFYDDCAYEEWKQSGDPKVGGFEPDHIHEVQHGGAPADIENFAWLRDYVNGSIGSTLKKLTPEHDAVTADCCDG